MRKDELERREPQFLGERDEIFSGHSPAVQRDNTAQSGLDGRWKMDALQTVLRHRRLAAPDYFGPTAGAESEDSAAGLDGMGRFITLTAMLAGMDRILVFTVIRCVVGRTHE